MKKLILLSILFIVGCEELLESIKEDCTALQTTFLGKYYEVKDYDGSSATCQDMCTEVVAAGQALLDNSCDMPEDDDEMPHSGPVTQADIDGLESGFCGENGPCSNPIVGNWVITDVGDGPTCAEITWEGDDAPTCQHAFTINSDNTFTAEECEKDDQSSVWDSSGSTITMSFPWGEGTVTINDDELIVAFVIEPECDNDDYGTQVDCEANNEEWHDEECAAFKLTAGTPDCSNCEEDGLDCTALGATFVEKAEAAQAYDNETGDYATCDAMCDEAIAALQVLADNSCDMPEMEDDDAPTGAVTQEAVTDFTAGFCGDSGVCDVTGCMDDSACNYNADATMDDGNCDYAEENYDCDGNCTAVEDCAGTCGGSAVLSGCDNVCNSTAIEDCAGTCGGTMVDANSDGFCDDYQGTASDIEGNTYKTIKIGDQWWMAENLKTTKYKDGTAILTGYSNSDWGNLSTGAYTVYDDDPSNSAIYGNLYNWYAVDDERGLCPEGFHIPSDDEFKVLEIYLGMSQEEADVHGWRGTNESSKLAGNADLWENGNLKNNSESEFGASGFDALPSGWRSGYDGSYDKMGKTGFFWSSTESTGTAPWHRDIDYYITTLGRLSNNDKQYGFSVRCIKD